MKRSAVILLAALFYNLLNGLRVPSTPLRQDGERIERPTRLSPSTSSVELECPVGSKGADKGGLGSVISDSGIDRRLRVFDKLFCGGVQHHPEGRSLDRVQGMPLIAGEKVLGSQP